MRNPASKNGKEAKRLAFMDITKDKQSDENYKMYNNLNITTSHLNMQPNKFFKEILNRVEVVSI